MPKLSMKTLSKEQTTYLCSTEEEVKELIEAYRADQEKKNYILSKYNSVKKQKKDKETKELIIYYKVTIERTFEDAEEYFFN